MTAVMSTISSPSPSSHQAQEPSLGVSQRSLPPLNTDPPLRRSTLQRPPSYAKNRISSYSTTSINQNGRSRPSTQVFPTFHSSLPYALVRDFAYPIIHPHHYGPPPEPSGAQSGASTPLTELQRTLSEPQVTSSSSWVGANAQWPGARWDADRPSLGGQLPHMAYGDGPPYSEDEDLHSPVVTSSRHKKSKSSLPSMHTGHERRSPRSRESGESKYRSMENYFAGGIGDSMDTTVSNPQQHRRSNNLAPNAFSIPRHRDSHFAAVLPNRAYTQDEEDGDSDLSLSGEDDPEPEYMDDSRYSRDYQFTIASLDEEMHGKAVALFDFARENENELPLVEGQVILVSYRQQQGWLVAQDPRTGESGLVPEEYVRLLRDIEGGYASLSGLASAGDVEERDRRDQEEEASSPEEDPTAQQQNASDNTPLSSPSPNELSLTKSPASMLDPPTESTKSPTTTPNGTHNPPTTTSTSTSTDRRPPVVSSFSTSSSDLNPIPPHLLTHTKSSETPPPVNHYGSQANTPTMSSPPGGALGGMGWGKKDSGGVGDGGEEGAVTLSKGAFGQEAAGGRND